MSEYVKVEAYICYLATPRLTLGHSWGDSLSNLMLITAFVNYRFKGHPKLRSEVGSINLVEHLVGFEAGTFRFDINVLAN